MSYKIILDSCGELTDEMQKIGNYINVPLTLQVGETKVIDDETFNQKDFLELVASTSETVLHLPGEGSNQLLHQTWQTPGCHNLIGAASKEAALQNNGLGKRYILSFSPPNTHYKTCTLRSFIPIRFLLRPEGKYPVDSVHRVHLPTIHEPCITA